MDVESDSAMAISGIDLEVDDLSTSGLTLRDIKIAYAAFASSCFAFVRRIGNKPAHLLDQLETCSSSCCSWADHVIVM